MRLSTRATQPLAYLFANQLQADMDYLFCYPAQAEASQSGLFPLLSILHSPQTYSEFIPLVKICVSGLGFDSSMHPLEAIFNVFTPLTLLIISAFCRRYIDLLSADCLVPGMRWTEGNGTSRLVLDTPGSSI